MIIVCPNCSTRYMIPDGSIQSPGRKVRCNNCGETWLETGDGDEAVTDTVLHPEDALEEEGGDTTEESLPEEDSEDDEFSIPQAVKPEAANDKAVDIDEDVKKNVPASIVLALVVLCSIVLISALSADKLILGNPSLRPVFKLINTDNYGDVKDVIFDHVEITYNDENSAYDFSGFLINIDRKPIILPPSKVMFSDSGGELIEGWSVHLIEDSVLVPEASIKFSFEYPMDKTLAEKVRTVSLNFVDETTKKKDKSDKISMNKSVDHEDHY